MGRHTNAQRSRLGLRRMVVVCGPGGGMAWILDAFVPDQSGLDRVLSALGAVLLTIALVALGLLLVRSDFLALRLFVAVALPTLVWALFSLVHGSNGDPDLLEAVFGGLVGLGAGAASMRRGSQRRATL